MDDTVISIRLPKSLHKQLKAKATKNVRSINGEIVVAIRRHLTGAQPTDEATPETQEQEVAQ